MLSDEQPHRSLCKFSIFAIGRESTYIYQPRENKHYS